MKTKLQFLEVEAVVLYDDDFAIEHTAGGQARAQWIEQLGENRFSGFSSRLWMRISSPSRKINARKPSHFGSKIHVSPAGTSSTRLASIGNTGGFTGRCTFYVTPTPRLLIRNQTDEN
jgi:hypothetical protein